MGDNKWSGMRKQKKKLHKQMEAEFIKEFQLDDEEKDKYGKK